MQIKPCYDELSDSSTQKMKALGKTIEIPW